MFLSCLLITFVGNRLCVQTFLKVYKFLSNKIPRITFDKNTTKKKLFTQISITQKLLNGD